MTLQWYQDYNELTIDDKSALITEGLTQFPLHEYHSPRYKSYKAGLPTVVWSNLIEYTLLITTAMFHEWL